MSSVFAVIAAAGSSQRMNASSSKVTLQLRGRTVLERSLAPFIELSIPVAIMVREKDKLAIEELLRPVNGVFIVTGGDTRGESVSLGLAFLRQQFSPKADDIVLVHDAARCLVTTPLISSVIATARRYGAAVPALAVNDTLKRVNVTDSVIIETVDRAGLYSVQTPQGFRFELLNRAYGVDRGCLAGSAAATDDAGLVEQFAPVTIIEGCPFNIKLTRPADIELAKTFLSFRESVSSA